MVHFLESLTFNSSYGYMTITLLSGFSLCGFFYAINWLLLAQSETDCVDIVSRCMPKLMHIIFYSLLGQ